MRIWMCLAALMAAISTVAAAPITPQQRASASDAFQRADWPSVATAYAAILAVEDHPAQHGRYGIALVELGKPADALPHLEKSFATIPNPRVALYLARANAKLGKPDAAFAALDKMIAAGGVPIADVGPERDFAALAKRPRFKELVAKNAAAVEPCRASPEFRQFDFWIGDWTVADTKGNAAGTSHVELILNGCTLVENWTGTGSSGKSFNIYDGRDKKWHQTWVDDRGTFAHYIGELAGGKMIITADQDKPGKPQLARMTFSKLPDGTVRQFGEGSTDGGKTWTTTFDLIYTKK